MANKKYVNYCSIKIRAAGKMGEIARWSVYFRDTNVSDIACIIRHRRWDGDLYLPQAITPAIPMLKVMVHLA